MIHLASAIISHEQTQSNRVCCFQTLGAVFPKDFILNYLGLNRSCDNESDWPIPGENTYPMIPGDAIKCTTTNSDTLFVVSLCCRYKCVDPNVYIYSESYPPIHHPTRGYQLISRCSSSNPDLTIRDLCENPDADRDLETLFPVTDYSTGLDYRNQYCSLCDDQVDLDSVRRWAMDIGCENYITFTYEKLHHIIKERLCNVSFVPPDQENIEACMPYHIAVCNVSGLWQEYNETLELACNSFIDPFNFTYKNVFCFLCNTDSKEPFDLWKCQTFDVHKRGVVTNVNPPFLAMLDLSAVLKKRTNEHIQCNEHAQFRDDKMVRY